MDTLEQDYDRLRAENDALKLRVGVLERALDDRAEQQASDLQNSRDRWREAARYHFEYGCRVNGELGLARESATQAHAEVARLQMACELLEAELAKRPAVST